MSRRLERIASAPRFQYTILGVIVANGVLVGLETSPAMVERFGALFHLLDLLILSIFTIEIAIRIGAYGRRPWRFFTDPWNLFDFIVVAIAFMPLHAQYVAVLRLARILRVLRLVTAVPRLQLIVGALLRSIPSMGYIGILLGLHFYIYGVMGTFLWGANDPFHFGNLAVSMLSLFRAVTLEDWTDLMYIQMYGCAAYGYGEMPELCTRPSAAPIGGAVFFVSFVLLGTMIILNLFIGVIMSNMTELQQEAERKQLVHARTVTGTTITDELHLLNLQLEDVRQQMRMIQDRVEAELPPPPRRIPPAGGLSG
jgi:voltage-gated sodium channel